MPTPQELELLANFSRNKPYVKQGVNNYNTKLSDLGEMGFRQWTQDNHVPFNPDQQTQDYDMRGYYQGLQDQNPHAVNSVNPNDQQIHYPDYWKTPYHQSFSNESQYAAPVAPQWNMMDQLVSPGGQILFDERNKKKGFLDGR